MLLDQGVRTWGVVRLVLAAAALALGKRAARGPLALRIGATSNAGQLIDPLQATGDELAQVVEASDFSPHPGPALEKVLKELAATDDDILRDVVLLTQVRNVAEADVSTAARRWPAGVRLFAVAVEESGEGELCEMRRGVPVKVRPFRVDLTQPSPIEKPSTPLEAPRPWQGDVEPIGYPFLMGPRRRRQGDHYFDFDHAGKWILESGVGGTLHAWRIDGSAVEVLPRGMLNRQVLRDVTAVIGVRGGFVVVGQVDKHLMLFHYDFARRHCTAIETSEIRISDLPWFYLPDLHLVATRTDKSFVGFNLLKGGPAWRVPLNSSASDPTDWTERLNKEGQTIPLLVAPSFSGGKAPPFPRLIHSDNGIRLVIDSVGPPWDPILPTRDGQLIFKTHFLLDGLFHNNVLLLRLVSRPGDQHILTAIRGQRSEPLGEIAISSRGKPRLMVSRDGRWLARATGHGRMEVRELGGNTVIHEPFQRNDKPLSLVVELGECWLTAQARGMTHLISWIGGQWHHNQRDTFPRVLVGEHLLHTSLRRSGVRAESTGLSSLLGYDDRRWLAGATNTLLVGVDIHGQIVLLERTGEIVAMVMVRGVEIAVWMPDGVRFGSPALLGGPPTPDAESRLGPALHRAWVRNEETIA